MLHEFLSLHRAEVIERFKSKAAPAGDHEALPNGAPLILDQLIETLRAKHAARKRSNVPDCARFDASRARGSCIDKAAARHGRELLRNAFAVQEIVYGYGGLRQAVTDLALERNEKIQASEFRALNRCLDNAIADSLISYFARAHTPTAADDAVQPANERLGFLAHELRNHLQTATIALAASRSGNTGSDEAAAAMLERSLTAMRNLVDRSLADVRAMAEQPARRQTIALAEFTAELRRSASLEAKARACTFIVEPVDSSLGICADKDQLYSALSNLLQNAFKFTRRHTQVTLRAFAAGDRAVITVEDNCGGVPPGDAEQMFQPFMQNGDDDRCGAGLGLSICRRSVHANGGILSFRNNPGTGCVFTIDMPRQPMVNQRQTAAG